MGHEEAEVKSSLSTEIPSKSLPKSEAKSACRIVGRLGQELPQEPTKESPKSHDILDTIVGFTMTIIHTKIHHQGFIQTRTRIFSRAASPRPIFVSYSFMGRAGFPGGRRLLKQ